MIYLDHVLIDMEKALEAYCLDYYLNSTVDLRIRRETRDDGNLAMPKILYTIDPPVNHEQQPMVTKEVVSSVDKDFSEDIIYNYYSYPRVKITFTAYQGQSIIKYMARAQDWFRNVKLGKSFFADYNIVVKEVEDIKDDSSKRGKHDYTQSFTVLLQCEQVIRVRENTIEDISFSAKSSS